MSSVKVPNDVLADIAGIEPGSPLALLRSARPEIVRQTQNTFLSIFEPENDSGLTRPEREAVAVWVATLAKAPNVAAFHRARLIALGSASERLASIGASVDELDLTSRERALLRHAELLTNRPATAEKSDTDLLLNAGVTPSEVVGLAQLVAFMSFEIRTIAVLKAFERSSDQ